jgi:hypothetical protein
LNSQITESFVELFRELPEHARTTARKNYRLWKENSSHPSLQFKRVHTTEPLYSVRIGIGWRALGLLDNDTMTWFWIGSHAEYDKLIERYR